MAKTAFVTGATGFVGLNVVEALCEQGWQVIALHRPSSHLDTLKQLGKIDLVTGDITDIRSLRAAMPARVDCVFHLAGNTSLWSKAQVEQIKVNVRGTRNVMRAALESGARKVVHTSSIVAYGLHGGTITEETPSRGSGNDITYIRSKALSEREVHRALSRGLKAVILNPSHMIGRYDSANWARLFRLIKIGRLPGVPPGGGSFCHARAVAEAQVAAAERGVVGEHYLLGGAQASYVGLARLIAERLGLKRRIVALHPGVLSTYARLEEWIAPVFGREPDVTRAAVSLLSANLYCSSRKAEKVLGYKPLPLQNMVDDCIEWMRSAGTL